MRSHGWRRVTSGSFPLYRLLMTALLISAVLGLTVGSAPDSVTEAAGLTGDILYLSAQLAGSGLVILALHIRKAWMSLQLERLGTIAVATNSAIYAVAVINTYGLPTAAATWGAGALGLYCTYRALREIPRELRELRAVARAQCHRTEEVEHG